MNAATRQSIRKRKKSITVMDGFMLLSFDVGFETDTLVECVECGHHGADYVDGGDIVVCITECLCIGFVYSDAVFASVDGDGDNLFCKS